MPQDSKFFKRSISRSKTLTTNDFGFLLKTQNNIKSPMNNNRNELSERYLELKIIAKGCFATITKVYDHLLKKYFAMKTLNKKYII
jgi:hypothetical protein